MLCTYSRCARNVGAPVQIYISRRVCRSLDTPLYFVYGYMLFVFVCCIHICSVFTMQAHHYKFKFLDMFI